MYHLFGARRELNAKSTAILARRIPNVTAGTHCLHIFGSLIKIMASLEENAPGHIQITLASEPIANLSYFPLQTLDLVYVVLTLP